MPDRNDAKLGAGAAGFTVAANANRVMWVGNDRKKKRIDREIGQHETGIKQVKASKPRPTNGQNWRDVANQTGLGDDRKSAARRAARAGHVQQIKQHQTKINELRSARRIPAVSRHTVEGLAIGGMGIGIAGLYSGARGKAQPVKKYTKQDVDHAAGGALLGTGAYYGASYGTKGIDRKANAKVKADPKLAEIAQAHRTKHGITPHTPAGSKEWKNFFRQYPKELPGAKWKRTLGHTHGGKRGLALVATTAAVSGTAAQRVGKAQYGYNERRTSPLRATETAAGVALLGWGGSRNSAFKGALKIGRRQPGNLGIAARKAEIARKETKRVTGAGAKMIQQQTGYTGRGLRPIEATAAGALLIHNGLPIRRDRFTQTQGW